MSFSFSYTAPMVSEEQEQAELEALTEAERMALQADLHPDASKRIIVDGSSVEINDDDEDDSSIMQRSLVLCQEALQQIPENEKLACTEALEHAPELVEKESGMKAFLRCGGYDVWSAALRIVNYWKIRKKLFRDRFLLEMTQTGGALSPDDVATLKKGVVVLLPADDFGRPVVFLDRSKVFKGSGVDVKSVPRCILYVRSVAAESSIVAQKRGLVMITYMKGCDLYTHYDRGLSRDIAALAEALPIKLATVHIILLDNHEVIRKILIPTIKFFYRARSRQRLVMHSGYNRGILKRLLDYGIHEEKMSSVLDGALGKDYFDRWMEERRALEGGSQL